MARVTHLNDNHRGADGLEMNADDIGIDAIAGLAATDVQGALEEIAFGPSFNVYASLTNKSGGTVDAGDVVIIDPANADAFKTTTTAAEEQTVMIVQETILANATGLVATSGAVLVVNTNAVSTTRGHYLFTSTGAKIATASATRGAGAFGQVISGGADPEAIIWGVGDQNAAGISDIVDLPTAETDTTLVLAPDGGGGVEFRAETGGAADITDIPTAETDTSLRLAPDGVGGVEWAAGGSGAVPNASVSYTGGDITTATSGTNKQAFHASGLDVTIAAATNDVLLYSINAIMNGNNTGELRSDAATVVSGVLTNYLSGGSATTLQLAGLYLPASQATLYPYSATILYTVQAGDISGGNVTIRPVYVAAANAKTMKATGNYPVQVAVMNLGQ